MLGYDGHDVFAMPSANMAAVFQVFETLPNTPKLEKARARLHVAAAQIQCLRKENSSYWMQSSTLLTPFFDMYRDKQWNGEVLLIWKELTCVTWESADFTFADGPGEYSSLEGIDAYGNQPMMLLPMGREGNQFGRR